MSERPQSPDTSPANSSPGPSEGEVGAFVTFLSSPEAFPRGDGGVEVKETHKSWVFLCGEHVYKLKKPVRNHLQDLTTLATREENARNEVRLNRRLAPEIYLGAVPLTRLPDGELCIDGRGTPVDWLVHMKRIPEAMMLDHAIASGSVTRERIECVIHLLADFYQGLDPFDLAPEAYFAHFVREHLENARILTTTGFGFGPRDIDVLLDAFASFLEDVRPLLQERACAGRIVEGHGDLRPEHVCLSDPPVIIDCLEFNLGLRLVDPHDELGYLGLECQFLGAPWIAERLLTGYATRSGDHCPLTLLSFYQAYRGFVRARLSLAHLLDPGPQDQRKWVGKTLGYLKLAGRALVTQGKLTYLPAILRDEGGGWPLQIAVPR
jgi:uncharacterized protein